MTEPPLLHHERVAAPRARPGRWLYVLHGIFGAGRNWGSVARRLAAERPDWGAILVDLREHGRSRGFPPPHTLGAAADDLERLARHLGLAPTAVLGHSFGGKVALAWARRAPAGLEQVWLIDSTPAAGPPGGAAWEMLHTLRALPGPFPDRAAAVRALEARGVATPVAQWVSTNLEPGPDGLRWRLDLDAMEALLRDFFQTDLWDVLEHPPPGVRIHVVRATRSSVLDDAAAARIEAAGRRDGRVFLHAVPGGHWLNADNPDALVALLARHLGPAPPGHSH